MFRSLIVKIFYEVTASSFLLTHILTLDIHSQTLSQELRSLYSPRELSELGTMRGL